MSKRKTQSKLLTYYLNLAELGDQQAERKAEELASIMFKDEPEVLPSKKINVIFLNGTRKVYKNYQEAARKLWIDTEELIDCLENDLEDQYGRRYCFFEE